MLELAKSDGRGMEERRKDTEPVLDARVSQERNPSHDWSCVMVDYFNMPEWYMRGDRTAARRILELMSIHSSQAS